MSNLAAVEGVCRCGKAFAGPPTKRWCTETCKKKNKTKERLNRDPEYRRRKQRQKSRREWRKDREKHGIGTTRLCECGTAFILTRKNRRWCKTNCPAYTRWYQANVVLPREQAKRLTRPERFCPCGKSLAGRMLGAKYCSARCASREVGREHYRKNARHILEQRRPRRRTERYREKESLRQKRWRRLRRLRVLAFNVSKLAQSMSQQSEALMSASSSVPAFVSELDQARAEMRDKGRPALLKIIRRGFVFIREKLLEVSAALIEAEAGGERVRPEDVGCERWFIEMARLIGAGKLLVDVAMRFGGRGHTFDALKAMPIEKQAELLEEKTDEQIERELRRPRARLAKSRAAEAFNGYATRHPLPASGEPLEDDFSFDCHADRPAFASPEEAAERSVEIVNGCSDPQAAAELLMVRLLAVLRKPS